MAKQGGWVKLQTDFNTISMSLRVIPVEAHSCMQHIFWFVTSLMMINEFCSQPSSGLGCLTDSRLSMVNEVHVISLTGGLGGNAITKRPHNLHYFISKPWILPFSLILSCSPFVQSDCCFLRWKTLVWQPSKSHRTLKVTCIAVLFILILYPIWRWWSKGSELKKKLKEVCFGVNSNNTNP